MSDAAELLVISGRAGSEGGARSEHGAGGGAARPHKRLMLSLARRGEGAGAGVSSARATLGISSW